MMKSKTTINGTDTNRFCHYLLEGVIEIPKRCLLNHECHHCGFDQWLEETGETERRWLDLAAPKCVSLDA